MEPWFPFLRFYSFYEWRNCRASHLTYVIILQGGKVTATCFSDHKCWLHDGAISIGWINSQGKIQEMHHGELVNGKITTQDNV
jgi:hypothetical protein